MSILLSSLFGCNQKSTCQDFQKGNFIIKLDTEVYSKYERTENTQIETDQLGNKIYYSIEWISECSFIQKFDEDKMELTDEMKMVNKDGGVVIELLDIIGDGCISYQSYVKNFKDLSLKKGSFCKN
ncbi:hypothetical protein Q4Q39_08370 [Flavivirga amylovorans]|uniref:Lipoprotein n=1 Tax=Flavivirga amylovorans TaxID=870486 RepID=A0ABT8X0E2_9FLAO|nr:hypothetical protein [Flavivirga amylovorans]MDO5987407.1 hypothetical protein [Flavivirga amylovorans]